MKMDNEWTHIKIDQWNVREMINVDSNLQSTRIMCDLIILSRPQSVAYRSQNGKTFPTKQIHLS